MKYRHIPMSSFRAARKSSHRSPSPASRWRQYLLRGRFRRGNHSRRAAAGILANLSNTAWFGHSLAQPQHLQIARMRAVETGRPMLRATNTGMTAIVLAPAATCRAYCQPFTTGVLRAEVRAYTGMTPYARFGNWGFLLLAVCCLLLAAGYRNAVNRKRSVRPAGAALPVPAVAFRPAHLVA
jgi:hypothetical protein